MQVTRQQLKPTTIKLTITADAAFLGDAKNEALRKLGSTMKIPGFRQGKAPLNIIERHANADTLQSEFLDAAVNQLYSSAIDREHLRPVANPQVTIQKFVPFTTLEFTAEVEVVGEVTIPDYKKLRVTKTAVTVTPEDVEKVIQDLRMRLAERKEVDRAAAKGDEVTIDFAGKDAKSGQAIAGADGKQYPLVLGSDAFIPGFETHVLGIKPGQSREFTLTFPADYGVSALQNREVTFSVTVSKVSALSEPKVDGAFASQVGPFKTIKELRSDIERQLHEEKRGEAERAYENELLEKLAEGTTVAVPESLVDDEVRRLEQQQRQNLAYRGQTWPEYLASIGQTEDEYHQTARKPALQRIKVGLALSEVAEHEGLTVTPEELRARLQLLREQYKDAAMQAEFEKPDNVRSILSNMLSEKTIAKLVEYAAGSGTSTGRPDQKRKA